MFFMYLRFTASNHIQYSFLNIILLSMSQIKHKKTMNMILLFYIIEDKH